MKSARDLFEHELQSMYDGAKRLVRGLGQMATKVSHPELSSKIDELRKASEDQARRLEEIFGLIGARPTRSESRVVRGFLDDFSSLAKERKPEKEPLDAGAASSAGDIAQYLTQTLHTMLVLAERSGVTHTSPKVGGLLKVSARESKKIGKDIEKLMDPLVEQMRPS